MLLWFDFLAKFTPAFLASLGFPDFDHFTKSKYSVDRVPGNEIVKTSPHDFFSNSVELIALEIEPFVTLSMRLHILSNFLYPQQRLISDHSLSQAASDHTLSVLHQLMFSYYLL